LKIRLSSTASWFYKTGNRFGGNSLRGKKNFKVGEVGVIEKRQRDDNDKKTLHAY
jgi:hypothetical protein